MYKVYCIGEVLWDVLPAGMFLGGAPFNVACDLHQLGFEVTMVSRIGRDAEGARVIDVMRARGMDTASMQLDSALPTGIVRVDLDSQGAPHFTINRPSAWDEIEVPGALIDAIDERSIVVFGSLAQRSDSSRAAIRVLTERCAVRIFDVNLRAPYDDQEIVRASLERATILKLNRDEAVRIAQWFGLPVEEREFCTAIETTFGCNTICITQDSNGAVLYHRGQWFTHSGFPIKVKDTVGAGDAFLAGFTSAYAAQKSWMEILEYSNLLGAFVASSDGATPIFSPETIHSFRGSLPSI